MVCKKISYNTTAAVGSFGCHFKSRYGNASFYVSEVSLVAIRLKPKQGQRFKATIERVGK